MENCFIVTVQCQTVFSGDSVELSRNRGIPRITVNRVNLISDDYDQINSYAENYGSNADLTPVGSDYPLKFHEIHGDNIILSNDRTQAKRSDSFSKGICFSSRPVSINERVYLKFIETATTWSGVLRFGFTNVDPGMARGPELPRYACPDMTNKPGYWAKALGDRHGEANSLLCFHVTRAGDIMYAVNGIEKGLFLSGINTSSPLWALLDVYGNTMAVAFASPDTQLNNSGNLPRSPSTQQTRTSSYTSRWLETTAQSYLRYNTNVDFTPLLFHSLCGKNTKLSDAGTIASREKDEYCNAYAFTSRPLKCGENIVVQVLGVDRSFVGGLAFGFTSCDPSTLAPRDLPDDSDLLLDRLEYWVVNKDVCRSPDLTDELSFHLTEEGEVKYTRNNHKPATLMHVDKTLPLWAFFDVYGNVQRIKLLGVAHPHPTRPQSVSYTGASPLPSPNGGPQSLPTRPTTDPVARSASLDQASPQVDRSLVSMDSSTEERNPESDNQSNECHICYERPVNCVLYTCGHMCMCYECAIAVKKKGALCPICRQQFKDVIKFYRS